MNANGLFFLGVGLYFSAGFIAVGVFLAIKKERGEDALYELGRFLWARLGRIVILLGWFFASILVSIKTSPPGIIFPAGIMIMLKLVVMLCGLTLISALFLLGFTPELRRGT